MTSCRLVGLCRLVVVVVVVVVRRGGGSGSSSSSSSSSCSCSPIPRLKFTLEQATKAQRGSRGLALLFLQPRRYMGWVVSTTPRSLYPRERPGTHCIGTRLLRILTWILLQRNSADGVARSTEIPATVYHSPFCHVPEDFALNQTLYRQDCWNQLNQIPLSYLHILRVF
jgi:preprotein translocase subunit SecG